MQNNNYFEELIVSYLSNNLDAEEEAFIIAWINDSNENKQYFEELKRTWNAISIKQINVDNAWKQFTLTKESIQKASGETKANNFGPKSIGSLRDNSKKKSSIYRILMFSTVAVSTVIIFLIGARLINSNKTLQPVFATDFKKIILEESNVEYQFNTTQNIKKIVLADGSLVTLHSNSSIRYNKPFINNRRDIILSGKANFTVSKDKSRPFTVTSGDIATTALGTQFTVTAYEGAQEVTVRLFEGKVIIKPSDRLIGKLKNNYYLLPQQELIYNNINSVAKVTSFRSERISLAVKHTTKKAPLENDQPSIPEIGKETWYMFNNQPLNAVFDQLNGMFHTDIKYKKNDVAKIYFIGKFNVSDSLSDILKQISTLNKLKVTKKNNTFIINK
jgi:transmembrane sensor